MKKTPLHEQHLKLGAKMGGFAGYDMPLYYPEGVIKEHEWVRAHAGLFDVSHMGQIMLEGPDATEFLETVTPSSFSKLKKGAAKYTVLTNEEGGIIDDLIVTRRSEDRYFAVLNAGRKYEDIKWLEDHLPEGTTLDFRKDYALIALQGPTAKDALFDIYGLDLEHLAYMSGEVFDLAGAKAFVSRVGYTGEDGFEISVEGDMAAGVWKTLLTNDEVKPIGLAARDSLRLEVGYALYGHDINKETTPVEAGLRWVIARDHEDYIGAPVIRDQLENGVKRKLVGIKLLEKGVAREGAILLDPADNEIGHLTSGGFSPSLKTGIGMGYVGAGYKVGDEIQVDVRGRRIKAEIVRMPLVEVRTMSTKKV